MIKVLIVEDDPMVADINNRYLTKIEGFTVVGHAHTVNEAIEELKNEQVNLILLDIYMPGKNGLELLTYVREHEMSIDVILITAASEVDKIKKALRYGVVDYLIKPFVFERFQQALTSYREQFLFFTSQHKVMQNELDQMLYNKEQKIDKTMIKPLPKGLTVTTLKIVMKAIEEVGKKPFSTDDIAEKTDISRVSIGKYLKFLNKIHILEETITYGIGRPVSLYFYNEENRVNLNRFY